VAPANAWNMAPSNRLAERKSGIDCPSLLRGQSRRFGDVRRMSGLPSRSDVSRPGRHFAFGPTADLCAAGSQVHGSQCLIRSPHRRRRGRANRLIGSPCRPRCLTIQAQSTVGNVRSGSFASDSRCSSMSGLPRTSGIAGPIGTSQLGHSRTLALRICDVRSTPVKQTWSACRPKAEKRHLQR
jgi:hypothetical protein